MIRQRITLLTMMALTIVGSLLIDPASGKYLKKNSETEQTSGRKVIWERPTDITKRDLFYGPGGKQHVPQPPFRFIKEDTDASSPKFDIEDQTGTKWKVKLGVEAQPETAATRIVWAAGYFVDEDYYFDSIKVKGLPKLSRGQKYVSPGGVVHGARLERKTKGQKEIGNWSWFKNPFLNTREFNGLKVVMALINNWDLKEDNNSIVNVGGAQTYKIADLGATFGKSGNSFTRSDGDVEDYASSKFIKDVNAHDVDFVMHSRPLFLLAIAVPKYNERTKMEKIVKDIPIEDAIWIGRLMSQLSRKQVSDAFRAAGYSPSEVTIYTNVIKDRTRALENLGSGRGIRVVQ